MKETYLAKRLEFKFNLDPLQAMQIESYLNAIGLTLDDDHARPDGYYHVTSLYFDTPQFDDYYAKEGGFLKRKKLRARVYGPDFNAPDQTVWLEIKKKHDMGIEKERIRLTPEEWKKFAEGDIFYFLKPLGTVPADAVRHKALSEFMYFFVRGNYRPVAVVSYERRAYVSPFLSTVRVTLDRHIEAARVDGFGQGSRMASVAPNRTVLEVKFVGKIPWWFTRMAETFNLERSTFSKYTRSVDKIRGELRVPLPK